MTNERAQEFSWKIRVYYEDTDAAGVVFYANYLRYMERARTEWLRYVGFDHANLMAQHGVLFAVKNLSIDYIKPARLDELLTVTSHLLTRRGASLAFSQSIKSQKNDLLSQAKVKVVCLYASTLKVSPIPKALLVGMVDDS